MVRLVVSLVILVLTLVIYGIVWLVQKLSPPPKGVQMVSFQQPPGMGFGRGGPPAATPGPFGPAPANYGAPQAGYGAPQGAYGAPPPQGGYGPPQQAGYGAAPVITPAPPGAIRVVVRPECTFDRLSDYMTRGGLSVTAPPGPAVAPGEPVSAVWQSDSAHVRYMFDPRTYLRALEITGPGAEQTRQGLIQMAALPAMDGVQIAHLLQTARPGDQILGLTAAEYLGPNPQAQMYFAPLAALSQSAQPEIAQAAQRARQRLGA